MIALTAFLIAGVLALIAADLASDTLTDGAHDRPHFKAKGLPPVPAIPSEAE